MTDLNQPTLGATADIVEELPLIDSLAQGGQDIDVEESLHLVTQPRKQREMLRETVNLVGRI